MKIGGHDRPIHFGMNCWIEYCELRDISVTQMGEDLQRIGDGGGSGAEMRDLIWASLKDGARKAKEPFEVNNYDVGDWMDDIEQDELAAFFSQMAQSMENKVKQNGAATASKKKEKVK